jgi:hypothetical protein
MLTSEIYHDPGMRPQQAPTPLSQLLYRGRRGKQIERLRHGSHRGQEPAQDELRPWDCVLLSLGEAVGLDSDEGALVREH